MKTINLTVIGDVSCATTRTYLTFLKQAGLRPQNLWLVRFNHTGPRGAWAGLQYRLRKSLRREDVLGCIATPEPEYKALCEDLMAAAAVIPVDLFGSFDYEAHAVNTDYFAAADYTDLLLQKRILKSRHTAFLYTNGGIVPEKMLANDEVRILHMHPGVVPHVRGSDCFLWSNIVRGRPGVSCFYMSAGIDEGRLIQTMEFHQPDLSPLHPHLSEQDDDLAYRALLFSIDPQLRGQVLVEVLQRSGCDDLRVLPCKVQPTPNRPAYLWLHPVLRAPLMQRLAQRRPSHDSGRIHNLTEAEERLV